ncbi:MAG: HAMP domain-containing protein [Anaerolineae bacterium]|nr:HAMP domain-containing protein [Anaerolineae bacterium]
MSIRRKNFLIGVTALLISVALLYGLTEQMLLSSYTQLEVQNVEANIERASSAIKNRLTQLSGTVADWAYWDDTYYFIQGENDSYINDNMMDDTLVNLDLNAVVLLNSDGDIVYQKMMDLQTGEEIAFPTALAAKLAQQHYLLDLDNLDDQVTGLVESGDEVMVTAMRHILDSQGDGPIEGTLIFGQYLDAPHVEAFSSALRLALTTYPIEGDQLPADAIAAKSALLTGSHIFSQPLNDKAIAGYTLLEDLQGNPVRILKSAMSRDIYAQGQRTIYYFLTAVIMIGALLISSTIISVDRLVLSRLMKLKDAVTNIRNTGDTSLRVAIGQHDEITDLGNDFNGMLSALERAQRELQQAHDQLEEQVAVRTHDLEQANAQLRKEIAEREQAQAELLQARDQALEALQLKTHILANVSHDARTPLSVISLRTELMQSGRYGPVTDRQREVMHGVLDSVHQLVAFIENLLSGSQIDSKRIRIKPVEVSPQELLQPLANNLQSLAEHKGLTFNWSVAEDLPATVKIDSMRFNQILQNLVNNAIKFTESGSVTVSIFQPDAEHWALMVTDTGIGIPPEMHTRIFEAFWQVDGSPTRAANRGIGLGLSIVKELTALMKGEIIVQSKPDDGSRVTVCFPLEPVQGTELNEHSNRVTY